MPSDGYEGWSQPRRADVPERSNRDSRTMLHHARENEGSTEGQIDGSAPETIIDVGDVDRSLPSSWLSGARGDAELGSSGKDDAYRGRGSTLPPPNGKLENSTRSELDPNAHPPAPGEHPSFDAKVAAKFLKLRATTAGKGDRTTEGMRGGEEARNFRGCQTDNFANGGPASATAFESDVERAMRELEQSLADEKSSLTASTARLPPGSLSRSLQPLKPGRTRCTEGVGSLLGGSVSVLSYPPATVSGKQQEQEEATGILSQMIKRRGMPGGGKGKSSGLRNMWKGSERMDEGRLPLSCETTHRRLRTGGGLADMWQGDERPEVLSTGLAIVHGRSTGDGSLSRSQRQGPGLKGMWSVDLPEEFDSAQPRRQGPGLRGLWSGPDEMATEDAVRNDAKAAYLRALDHDAQQRRAVIVSKERETQGIQWQAGSRNTTPPQRRGVNDAFGDVALQGGSGTTLTGIGAAPGTPRHRRWSNGEAQDRLADKAKKEAYAEELRCQIAEKEARNAEEKQALRSGGGVRRRVSTESGGVYSSVTRGTESIGTPHEDRRRHEHHGSPGSRWDARSMDRRPFESARRDDHKQPASPTKNMGTEDAPASQRPAPASGTGVGDCIASLSPSFGHDSNGTAADSEPRRVTAARRRLVEDVYGGGGMGAALGGFGYRRLSTGSTGAAALTPESGILRRMNELGIDNTRTENGKHGGHLLTGAGMQSLVAQSGTEESKWRKRAAAMEQQRALQEQIAAKARAKKEEADRRKQEDEEEARQQRERLRKMEAEAEQQRRRKQAEQQEQLQGLYRQQEAALKKKRGGAGGDADSRNTRRSPDGGIASAYSKETTPVPVYGDAFSTDANSCGFRSGATAPAAVGTPGTPRGFTTRVDFDDLPAGVQARAEILRTSPGGSGGRGAPVSSLLWRPVSGNGNPPAEPLSSRERQQGTSPASGEPFNKGAKVGAEHRPHLGNAGGSSTDLRDSRHGDTGGRAIGTVSSSGERWGRGGPGFRESATSGRTSSGRFEPEEPPLPTHSSLLPVSSESLFPAYSTADPHATLVRPREDIRRPSSSSRDWDRGPGATAKPAGVSRDQALAAAAGLGRLRQETTTAGTPASGAAAPPQDEMDAFVSSWQTEHLRRRGANEGSLTHKRERAHGTDGTGSGRAAGSPRPTLSTSPSRDFLRSSRARSIAGNHDDDWVPRQKLEDSLAATSRLTDLPLPMPPADTVGGVGGVGRGPLRSVLRDDSGGLNGGSEGSDRSLASDSMLYYLTDQQQEETPPIRKGAGYTEQTLSEMLPGLRDKRKSYGERDWGDGAASGPSSPLEASAGPLLNRGNTGQLDGDEDGALSPLTRLLAVTDVRLGNENGSEFRRSHGKTPGTARWGNSRWSEGIGRASQDYVAVMPADHRLRGRSSAEPLLASKGPEGGIEESQEGGIEESQGRPTPEERFNTMASSNGNAVGAIVETSEENVIDEPSVPGLVGDLFVKSTDDASFVVGRSNGVPGRTRAHRGPSNGGDAVAGGLTRRGGGMPWEEMPEVRESLSSDVP